MSTLPLVVLLAACAPKVLPPVGAERPLNVWEVERNGKVSTLVGTCHVGVTLDYSFPKPESSVIEAARVVYTEADLGGLNGLEALRMMWTDTRLSERLSAPAFARLVRGAPQLPASILDHFPPWVAGTLGSLSGAFAPGGGAPVAMDMEVQRRAEARNIPVRHVETLADQVALMSGFDAAFTEAMEAAPDPEGQARSQRALDDLCMGGSTDLSALIDPDDPTTEPMLYARNRAWMPTLLPELDQGGAVVAVGAAHMLGDQGLLALLAAEGFAARRYSTHQPRKTSAAFAEPAAAAPVDEARVARVAAAMTPALVGQLCAPAGIVRSCLLPEALECESRMTVDVGLCVSQVGASLPDTGTPGLALVTGVTQCAITGVMTEAMVKDRFGDAPVCAPMKSAMDAAMKQALGK